MKISIVIECEGLSKCTSTTEIPYGYWQRSEILDGFHQVIQFAQNKQKQFEEEFEIMFGRKIESLKSEKK